MLHRVQSDLHSILSRSAALSLMCDIALTLYNAIIDTCIYIYDPLQSSVTQHFTYRIHLCVLFGSHDKQQLFL